MSRKKPLSLLPFSPIRALTIFAIATTLLCASLAHANLPPNNSEVTPEAQSYAIPIHIATLNRAFSLTPEQVEARLKEAKDLEANSEASARFIESTRRPMKTTKGQNEVEGCAELSGIDGSDLIFKSLAQHEPLAPPLAPPHYTDGLYAPEELVVSIELVGHTFQKPSHSKWLNNIESPVKTVLITDSEGHVYPTLRGSFFTERKSCYAYLVNVVPKTTRPLPSKSSFMPLEEWEVNDCLGRPIANASDAHPPALSIMFLSDKTDPVYRVFFWGVFQCKLSLFYQDGSPRFDHNVRTITVRAFTETGEMDTDYDLTAYQHR